MNPLPKTRAVFEAGLAEGRHLGAQLYVAHEGRVVADEAFGQARVGVPMQRDSAMLWFSAGKPVTAVAVGQLVERGLIGWDTRVGEIIPEFSALGKEGITVRHLLTHTAGLRNADRVDSSLSWTDKLAQICALPPEPDWPPGVRAGYHVQGSWHLLGEIVRRVSGQAVEVLMRENIFAPLALRRYSLALTAEEIVARGDQMAFVYDTSGGASVPKEEWNSDAGLKRCLPGGSTRGPVRELGRFYDALLHDGEMLLRPETAAIMTSRQRTGMFDETFQFQMDWGLGFILNSNCDGLQMPYSFGRHAGRETFGHSGNQASCAFADPQHRLVVAWACNGLPGERQHQQRQRGINNAIYEDLNLAPN